MAAPSAGVWQPDTIRDIAESLGISNLSEEVATTLAADVEYRLHEMIEESIRFMRHAHRSTLKVEDVDHALKVRNLEPLWGFTAPNPLLYRKVTTNNATLYVVDDDEIDLERTLQTQLPPVPREVSFSAHWLAVEGVQPAVPQNPSRAELESRMASYPDRSSRAAVFASDSKHLTKRQLSRELQLYFERLTTAATDPDENMRNAALGSLRSDSGLSDLAPYLVQWISERIQAKMNDLGMLDHMLDLLHAIVDNQSLYFEPYLHAILPPVLSVLLASSIGQRQTSSYGQFSTRHHAASLLALLLDRYSHVYPTFKPRVLQILLRGLIQGKSFGTLFGAIVGIRRLGSETTKNIFAAQGNLKILGETLDNMGNASVDDIENMERNKCIEEVMTVLVEVFGSVPAVNRAPRFQDLESNFGTTFARQLTSRGATGQSIITGLLTFSKQQQQSDQKEEDKESLNSSAISLAVIQDAIANAPHSDSNAHFPFSVSEHGVFGDDDAAAGDDDEEEEEEEDEDALEQLM